MGSQTDTPRASGDVPTTAKAGSVFVKIFSIAIGDAEDAGLSQVSEVPVVSLKFDSKDIGSFQSATSLQNVREALEKATKNKDPFKFCTDDLTVVPEDLKLDAYSRMLRFQGTTSDGQERVYIVPSKKIQAVQATVLAKPPFLLKFVKMGDTAGSAVNTGALHSSSFKGQDPSTMRLREIRKLIGKMSSDPDTDTFCSLDGSTASDELTVAQYLELDRETVEEQEGTPAVIIRYRRTDAKVSASSGSKFHPADDEVRGAMERMRFDPNFRDRSNEELHADKLDDFVVNEQLRASDFAATDATPLKYTSKMDEDDWNSVLRNTCLLHGWKVDKKTMAVERAETPAFRLRAVEPPPLPPSPILAPRQARDSIPLLPSQRGKEGSEDAVPEQKSQDAVSAADRPTQEPTKALKAEDIAAKVPTKIGAIPSYAINDRSRIEIVLAESEFQESMAKNHFASSAVEANVSGGFGGYSVGVTGGMASETSGGQRASSKQYSKTMIGNYMFPRVTVFLRPEDLEPTEELRRALLLVKRTKNINALRKLYDTFGHLFCHSATLGGCLQTTKILTASTQDASSNSKDSFKASIGVAVSTPYGGGDVKASKETGESAEGNKKEKQVRETMLFEATGGNTILAAELDYTKAHVSFPIRWSNSVADFQNWRVIERSELSPIVDSIAEMHGFAEVRAWFFSAVPKLSHYLVIPESRTMHVRFKVANQNDSFERITGRTSQAYLGHDPGKVSRPVRTAIVNRVNTVVNRREVDFVFGRVVDLTVSMVQTTHANSAAMFFPHSTHGPVLQFPGGKAVGTNEDGRWWQTIWRLEVAQGDSLGPDTLICIKSCASANSVTTKSETSDPSKTTTSLVVADLALTVFRNQQGVFQPAITSSDEPSYWRLQRVAATPSREARFQHGEVVRLTWAFADQVAGFRDYRDDAFGRRVFVRPPECGSDVLCLKIPYPLFQEPGDAEAAGFTLVMSGDVGEDPILETITTLPKYDEDGEQEVTYNLHDLTFRLDVVGRNGLGDSFDYMNIASAPTTEVLQPGAPTIERVIAGATFGVAAAPFASLTGGVATFFMLRR